MNFQIKCRFTGDVRFEGEFGSLRLCVEAAAKSRANLYGANLSGADLCGANLSGADLCGANLSRADLCGANLSGADLCGANLSRADLSGANLSGANLSRADLSRANLSRANLSRADLSRANLSRAKWHEGVTLKRAPAKEATRSDGYLFRLLDCDVGWRVAAGCRFFTLDEAWRHWGHGPRANTQIGEESEDILILFEHHIRRMEKQA